MNRLWFGVGIFFFVLSFIQFNESQNILLWKPTILVSEYGYWVSLFFILVLVFMRLDFKAALVCSLSVFFYLIPILLYLQNQQHWEQELSTVLKIDKKMVDLKPDFANFLLPDSVGFVAPQTFVYSQPENSLPLSLDFYRSQSARPAPLVIVVHGGGWNSGDRFQMQEFNSYLAKQGFAVAAISYRLAPEAHWPAPREDLLQAIRFLKSRAIEFGVDSNRLILLGRSAGGQIAENVAYSSGDTSIKACIAFYAPADLSFAYQFGKEDDSLKSPGLLRDYLGGTPETVAKNYEDASPILWVTPKSPPTLLFHGPRDPLVWFRQSERLLAKLKEASVPAVLIEVPWATHAFDYHFNGPGGQLSTKIVMSFLRKVSQP